MRLANGRAPRTNPRNPTDANAAFSVVPVFGSTFKPSSFAAGLSAGLSAALAGAAGAFLFNGYSGLSRTGASAAFTPPLKSCLSRTVESLESSYDGCAATGSSTGPFTPYEGCSG